MYKMENNDKYWHILIPDSLAYQPQDSPAVWMLKENMLQLAQSLSLHQYRAIFTFPCMIQNWVLT